jgi:hypothetical protein
LLKFRENCQSPQRAEHSDCPDHRETRVLEEHGAPREHDDAEIDHVPAVSQVGIPLHEEALGQYLENALDSVDYLEQVLADFIDGVLFWGLRRFDSHHHAVT